MSNDVMTIIIGRNSANLDFDIVLISGLDIVPRTKKVNMNNGVMLVPFSIWRTGSRSYFDPPELQLWKSTS